jgi:hypothetical protein
MESAPPAPRKGDAIEYTYLSTLHPHPKDGMVDFQSDGHLYFLPHAPEEELVSVTTFLKDLFPPFSKYILFGVFKSIHTRFQFWVEHKSRFPNPRAYHTQFNGPIWPEKYDVFIPPETFEALARLGQDPESLQNYQPLPKPYGNFSIQHIQDAWVRDGVALHLNIELFLNRIPSPTPPGRDWCLFMQWLDSRHAEWEIVRSEMRVYHPDLNIAGTIDCLVRRRSDGRYIVVDWKRSSKLKFRPEDDEDLKYDKYMNPPFQFLKATDRNKYALQLNMYSIILRKVYGMDVAERYLVCLHPSNHGPIEILVPDFGTDPKVRKAMVQVLHARKEQVYKIREEQNKKKQEDSISTIVVSA